MSEWTFAGATADGTKIEIDGGDVFAFENGKIAVESSYVRDRTA